MIGAHSWQYPLPLPDPLMLLLQTCTPLRVGSVAYYLVWIITDKNQAEHLCRLVPEEAFVPGLTTALQKKLANTIAQFINVM